MTDSQRLAVLRSGIKAGSGQCRIGRLMHNGKLCARYKGSSRTACVQIINRN
ncbi:hypothetical protein [Streptomyces poriferorum]|uniref:Uncharacterized protein n=1 Tax=Streptomyces poriferorum TaxID=2798799 RepID=A0ABY9J7C0_9ACTN|nr:MULTISPECIES: hypothetical protein [unclassified Streptomyces]MDP5317331.1 hypothetical protein [Streptomyces sp. Alt4]WLQ62022.1 hypothetical protein P8A19_41855 [Streptomyces sp. Alt2]